MVGGRMCAVVVGGAGPTCGEVWMAGSVDGRRVVQTMVLGLVRSLGPGSQQYTAGPFGLGWGGVRWGEVGWGS
jgi:hypothetical protein